MTLIEFIKSQLSMDTEFGHFAKDIKRDKEFPAEKTEKEILSYLEFKTRIGGTDSILKSFLQAYETQKDKDVNQLDLDTNFSLLRTENWKFYKENFSVDKVILVGRPSDFYKAYCIDSANKKALYFDIKSSSNLNDISMVDEEKIHIGNLTEQVSVETAINLLENCSYGITVKPNKEKFVELIEFLKKNK